MANRKSLVSGAELKSYMSGIGLNEPQAEEADNILAGVQSELEIRLNRPVQPTHLREWGVTDASGYLNPSVTPVHRVISIQRAQSGGGLSQNTVETIAKVPLEEFEDGMKSFDLAATQNSNSFVVSGGIYVGVPGVWCLLEYIGGYIGYWDDSLKQAIKRVAARDVALNHDDTLSLRGDNAQEASQPDTRPTGWTEDEINALSRLRRRVISR